MIDRTITITHTERIFGRTVTVTETGPATKTEYISDHVRATLTHEIERARNAAKLAHAITTHQRLEAIELTDTRHWPEPCANPDPIGVSA